MVHPRVFVDEQAHARLSSLGLQWEAIEDAFKYGLSEASTATEDDAVFCKGVLLYSRLGRRLRELLRVEDWTPGRPYNQQTVESHVHGVRILHVTGNIETGNPDPRVGVAPERPGGAARRRLISGNAERTLLDEIPEETGYKEPKAWFLLYRMGTRTLKSELSYTENPTDDGGGIAWVERIVLPEVPLPPGLHVGDERLDLGEIN